MHSMLLSGDGLIIPLKTRVLSKLNLLHTHTHTHEDGLASGIPTRERTDTHVAIDWPDKNADIHVKTGVLSQANLLLSGSYRITKRRF